MSETADSMFGTYLRIFGVLCVLTAVSVAADLASLPGGTVTLAIIVFAVAVAKATYVIMYFMHLKFENSWKYALLLPTVILSIGLVIALIPDISMHYYAQNVPQVR